MDSLKPWQKATPGHVLVQRCEIAKNEFDELTPLTRQVDVDRLQAGRAFASGASLSRMCLHLHDLRSRKAESAKLNGDKDLSVAWRLCTVVHHERSIGQGRDMSR